MFATLATALLFANPSAANDIVACKVDCTDSPGNSRGSSIVRDVSDVEIVELDDRRTTRSIDNLWYAPTDATSSKLAMVGGGARIAVGDVELDTLLVSGDFAALQLDSSGLGELIVGMPSDEFIETVSDEFIETVSDEFIETVSEEISSLQLISGELDSFVSFGTIHGLNVRDTTVAVFENYGTITNLNGEPEWEEK